MSESNPPGSPSIRELLARVDEGSMSLEDKASIKAYLLAFDSIRALANADPLRALESADPLRALERADPLRALESADPLRAVKNVDPLRPT